MIQFFSTLLLVWTMFGAHDTHARRHVVVMHAFKFEPAVLQVAAGDTIVWENRDVVPHTATAADKRWDSGNIPAHAQRVTVVSGHGEQPFICVYHPNMVGKLIVK